MKKPVAPGIVSDINVTPMVDVMLVLLIIFMVITPLLSKGVTVELTKAKNPVAMKAADAEDAIIAYVTRDGQTYLSPGNLKLSVDEMTGKVSDLLTSRLDKTVYIRSDARAKYELVENVVDALRAAGVEDLGLLTEQQNPNSVEPVAPAPKASVPVPAAAREVAQR